MTRVTVNGQQFDFDAVVQLMDDDICRVLHLDFEAFAEAEEETNQNFVNAYCALHEARFGEPFVVN